MIFYLNPKFGNDATARPGSRAHPWRTPEAVVAAIAQTEGGPHAFVETHKPPPENAIADERP